MNADAAASIPLRIWAGPKREVPETDKLAQLFAKPNRLMGAKKFRRALSRALDLDGGVFLFLVGGPDLEPMQPGTLPIEIWPVRDALVTAEWGPGPANERGPIPDGWSFQIGPRKYIFPDSAVARIYWPDDHNPLAAFGPAAAAWRSADHIFRAEAFDDALVENGGQMAGYFTHEERRLDPEKLDTLKKSAKQRVTDPRADRSTPILPAGLKFTPAAYTQVEMQAIEMRQSKREDIARIFGVPPVMLGELEDANRSSLRELRRVFYENSVSPRAEFIEEELAVSLLPKLPPQFASYRLQLDVSQTAAMREDMDAQIERVTKLVNIGVAFGEAAEIVGLQHEPIDGEDERWIATSLQPVEIAKNPPAPAPAPGEEPEPEEERGYRERRAASERFESSLSKHDDAIGRAATRVFREYIRQQLGRIRRITGERSEPVVVRPWGWFTTSASWSASRRAYATLLDLEPERVWVEVKGISADELERLLVESEKDWGAQLWGELEKPIRDSILDAAKDAARALDRVAIKATNPRVLRHMATKRVQLTEGPMSVVAERVRAVLVKAMAQTSSMGTLADRVRGVLEELESQLETMREQLGTRAMMIARTESASAANAGRVAQFKASGVVQHEWVSSGDDLVREAHQIDGEMQLIGERFSNGMTEPGESGASPELVINCRCTTAPVIPDESSAFTASARPQARQREPIKQ